jgi:hypothetical protein
MANIPIFANYPIAKSLETSIFVVPTLSFAAQCTAKPKHCGLLSGRDGTLQISNGATCPPDK